MEHTRSIYPGLQKNADNKIIALFTAALCGFCVNLNVTALNVAYPAIGQELGADIIMLDWIANSYMLIVAVFSIPFGRLADIKGLKKFFLWGMALFSISSIMAFFANSAMMLIACRVLQGIGSAMCAVNSMAMVAAIFTKDRGKALGINMAAIYAGGAVGPFLGGMLTEYLNWRSIFLVNILLGTTIILLILWKIKGEWTESRGEKYDLTGAILFGLAIFTLLFGFSTLPAISGIILIVLSSFIFVALVKWEGKAGNPLFCAEHFRNKTFLYSNIASLLNYCTVFAVAYLLSLYLQYLRGFTPGQAGAILLTLPVIQASLASMSGRISDRVEPSIVASLGIFLTFIGLILLVFLTYNTSLVQIVAALVLIGIGIAFFISPNTNAIMSSLGSKSYGFASASSNTVRTMGSSLGMGIVIIVMSTILGESATTVSNNADLMNCIRITFIIYATICPLGIFFSLFRGKLR